MNHLQTTNIRETTIVKVNVHTLHAYLFGERGVTKDLERQSVNTALAMGVAGSERYMHSTTII